MMTILPPYEDEVFTPWPSRNQIKRKGHGIALPGRSFMNVALSDVPYLIGDILSDAALPYDCAKLQLVEVPHNGPQRMFNVVIEQLLTTDFPPHGFAKMYLERYLESFCKNTNAPGVPIEIFFEKCGSFYEEEPRPNPGC
jgi:hypothetical protein